MTRQMCAWVAVVMLVALGRPLGAQAPAPAPAPAAAPAPSAPVAAPPSAAVPVQLQIVIARYQGTKRISALPYAILTNGRPGQAPVRLRMNGSVPIPMGIKDGQTVNVSSFNYRQIGTEIDVMAIPSVEGRYGFSVTVADTSVYGADEVKAAGIVPGPPMFRTFNVASVVYLRDGETTEFTAATDRLTGEVTKVEVTLTVLK